MGFEFPDDKAQTLAKQTRDPLAAVALLAAARREDNPFIHPVVKTLSAKADNRPEIALVAVNLWLEIIKGGNTYNKQVHFPGMKKIWEVIAETPQLDADAVLDLAGSASFDEQTRALVLPLLRRQAARTNLSARQKATLASQFSRNYGLANEADQLMQAGGKYAQNYDILGLQAEIAIARLMVAYDPAAARVVVASMLADIDDWPILLDFENEVIPRALETSGAKSELRELAVAYLDRAVAAGAQSGPWFAAASDYYLRAGDRDLAIQTARAGLKYVPAAVGGNDTPNATPQKLAARAQGEGTGPVIALYRAGAIQEALHFGYLAGKDRYANASRAGEPNDPQWVLDDGWELYISSMVVRPIINGDVATQRRVFDAIKRRCTPLDSTDCGSEMRLHLAHLAAALGDRTTMHEMFSFEARALDQIKERDTSAYFAVSRAANWAHALELLKDAPREERD